MKVKFTISTSFKGLHLKVFISLLLLINSSILLAQSPNDSTLNKSNDTINKVSDLEFPINYNASDSIRFDVVKQKVYLFGVSHIEYGEISLDAGYVEYNMKNGNISAGPNLDSSGNKINYPHFCEGSECFDADSILFNMKSKRGLIKNTKSKFDESYLHGEIIKKQENNDIHVKNGKYTTCDLDTPHFHFQISKAILKPNDKIIAGPMCLYLGNVPTPLVLPFGFFPNKKTKGSGIIIPEYTQYTSFGYGLRNLGYYFSYKEYFDNQLTGTIFTNGSWGVKNTLRYRKRYKYNGNFTFSYEENRFGEADFNNLRKTKVFSLRATHSMDAKARPNSSLSANVNLGSSGNDQQSFNSSANDYLSNTKNSSIQYSKRFQKLPLNLTVKTNATQTTKSTTYTDVFGNDSIVRNSTYLITLPDINVTTSKRIQPFSFTSKEKIGKKWFNFLSDINTSYSLNAKNSVTAPDSLWDINNPNLITDRMLNGMFHNIGANTSFKILKKHFTLNPNISYRSRWYFQTVQKYFDSNSQSVESDTIKGFSTNSDLSLSANLSTKLYGFYGFAGPLKGKRNTIIRHVVTPQVSFSYNPNFSTIDSIFNDTGVFVQTYSPYDIGIYGQSPNSESGRIGFNLINSFEAKMKKMNDTTEEETFKKIKLLDNLSISTSYDIFRDSLKWADISMNARTTLFKKISINGRLISTPYSYNESGVTINKSMYKSNGQLLRFRSGDLSVGTNVSLSDFGDKNPLTYNKHSINWTLGVAYAVRFTRTISYNTTQDILYDTIATTPSLSLNSDLQLTKNWKLSARANYDFNAQDLSFIQLNVVRDLHCWEAAVEWVPIGGYAHFNFRINIKSAILQDVKYERNKPYLAD